MRITITSTVIEDGTTPPPVVGTISLLKLHFFETGQDEASSWIRARAEPLDTGIPAGFSREDETPAQMVPSWLTLLHGDGWQALWNAPRPVLGHVHLRGRLVNDLMSGAQIPVRGLVTRAAVMSHSYELGDGYWQPRAASMQLHDVDASPRWFEHDFSRDPDRARTVQDGVLVELDLDEVPPPPLRPVIVPGSLSAHGNDLWVADTHLPLVIRLRGGSDASVYRWIGGVLSDEQTASRHLHATAQGCWVTGADGVRFVDCGGTTEQLSDDEVWRSAMSGEVLAAQVLGPAASPLVIKLFDRGGITAEVPVDGQRTWSLAAVPDCFLLLLRGLATRELRLARLDLAGTLTYGPDLNQERPGVSALIGGANAIVTVDHSLHRVLPDLTLAPPIAVPSRPLRGVGANDRAWIMTHPPDGSSGFGEQHWLLTELDTYDLSPANSCLIPGVPNEIAATADGSVWAIACGVRRCPPGNGTLGELLDLSALV